MLFFIAAYLATDVHTIGEKFNKIVVESIYLLTQAVYAFYVNMSVANCKLRQYIIEFVGRNLLCCIAPRFVRRAMRLHNQAIETKIHSLLTKWSYQVTSTTNMTGVADYRQLRYAAAQLYRDLPHRSIAIYLVVVTREATMNGSQALDACLIETFHRSNPQFEVWIYWILHKYGNIYTTKRIGKCLHSEGIGRGTCSYPNNVDTIF